MPFVRADFDNEMVTNASNPSISGYHHGKHPHNICEAQADSEKGPIPNMNPDWLPPRKSTLTRAWHILSLCVGQQNATATGQRHTDSSPRAAAEHMLTTRSPWCDDAWQLPWVAWRACATPILSICSYPQHRCYYVCGERFGVSISPAYVQRMLSSNQVRHWCERWSDVWSHFEQPTRRTSCAHAMHMQYRQQHNSFAATSGTRTLEPVWLDSQSPVSCIC